jgi:cell division protein FtsB
MQVPDYRNKILSEKEVEIAQIRNEYISLLNQKNNYIREKEGENEELSDLIQDLKRHVYKLENDDKVTLS